MRIHGPNEPVYTIGVVARLLGISPQTLRLFEREGLIEPSRTENNMRLYSQNELQLLHRICVLVKEDGLNIAGVRTVLRVERHYEAMIQTLAPEGARAAAAAGGFGEPRELAGEAAKTRAIAGEGGAAQADEGRARQARPGGRATGPDGDEDLPRRGARRRGASPLDGSGRMGAGALFALLTCFARTLW